MLQLQYLSDCIMGGVFIVSSKYAEELWNLVRAAMIALVSLDCIDDDQQLLLMAYRMNPEIFEVHISNWFLPLKEYGGNHLTITDAFANPGREKQVSIVNRVRGKLGVIKKRLKYCKRIYDISKRYAR